MLTLNLSRMEARASETWIPKLELGNQLNYFTKVVTFPCRPGCGLFPWPGTELCQLG
jgi:hypothetical protein